MTGLSFDASGWSQDVHSAIQAAAERHGVPVEHLYALAQIESHGNASAQNPNSSASGLFQFINSTARQYGLTDPLNAAANADAGARLYVDNRNGLRSVLGREPTVGEMYLAHQQGLGGARRLLGNPNADAASLVGGEAVRLNGGRSGMTAAEFASIWTGRADGLLGGQNNVPAHDPARPPSVFNPPPQGNTAPQGSSTESIWDGLAGLAANNPYFGGAMAAQQPVPVQMAPMPQAMPIQTQQRDTLAPYMELFSGLSPRANGRGAYNVPT